jgi:hypothetical protein
MYIYVYIYIYLEYLVGGLSHLSIQASHITSHLILYIYVYIFMYIYIHIYIYIYIYMHMYIYIHVYIHMYIYLFIYILLHGSYFRDRLLRLTGLTGKYPDTANSLLSRLDSIPAWTFLRYSAQT